MFDPSQFVDMFKRDLANRLVARGAGAAQLATHFFDARGAQQQVRGRGRTNVKVERPVGPHGHARRQRRARCNVRGARVEFLSGRLG